MVVTSRVPTAASGVTQARTGSPSRCTVQVPHSAMPQPNLVPLACNSPRKTHSSAASGSACTPMVLPWSLKEVVMVWFVDGGGWWAASGQFEGQGAQALSRQGKHGVGHCRCNRWRAGFADAFGRFGAGHDVALDDRAFVHAQHRVIVKIALLHLAV